MGISSSAKLTMAGLASATSDNGTARNGAALPLYNVEPGTLIVLAQATIVTGSVVATFRVQGSIDGTTYYDVKPINNAAHVTITATGSVLLAVDVPGLSACNFFRVTATLSGAATAAGDLTQVDYRWLKWGTLTR